MEQIGSDDGAGSPPRRRLRIDDAGRECCHCGVYKQWSGYYALASAGVRGHYSDCKECHKARVQRETDPVKRKERAAGCYALRATSASASFRMTSRFWPPPLPTYSEQAGRRPHDCSGTLPPPLRSGTRGLRADLPPDRDNEGSGAGTRADRRDS